MPTRQKEAQRPGLLTPSRFSVSLQFRWVTKNQEPRTKNKKLSVLGEDGWRREAVFVLEVSTVEVFLPRQMEIGPVRWTDADNSGGADAFGDEVRLKTDLDAAAAQRGVSG